MKFIITAGGQGTKVWPMSRESKPKQFQNLVGDKTLYEYQIETLLRAYSVNNIFISTKKQYLHFIEKLSPGIPKQNIIVEPDFKKNRGPGEGYAFLKLAEAYPNEPFIIIQSDVLREPSDKFLEMLEEAERLQRKDRKFITVGQKAMKPTLGVDYMQLGDKIQTDSTIQVYKVDKFIERLSSYQETKELVENFNVSTHANHMCWYPELILEAYKEYRPDWYDSLMRIRDTFGTPNEEEETNKIYEQMAEGATEEVAKHVMPEGYLIIAPFRWTDIGTWGSIYDDLSKFGENYIDADVVTIDTNRTLIKGKKGKVIATLGVEDLVIVDTDDVLLVMRKEVSGDIKKILQNLKESGRQHYL